MDLARVRLVDMMSNYQSQKHGTVIVVFDAYRVEGNPGSYEEHHNVHVVFTKEAETADQYIERLVHTISPGYDVTVATSDRVEQVIIMGSGAKRLSAEGLKLEVDAVNQLLKDNFLSRDEQIRHRMNLEEKQD